jgi:hypothetical protein
MAVVVVLGAACSTSGDDQMTADQPATTTSAVDRRDGASETTDGPGSATSPTGQPDAVEGTVLRFASADVQIDVTITQDNPTVRDLLSLLPLTITFEEFSGREKIGYPPRRLMTEGSPGHDSEDGDLIYFSPWGNLGFYYNAEGIGHDDRVIHLGTFSATREQLAGLEAGDVTITVAR